MSTGIYRFGEFALDVRERRIQRNGNPIALTPKAFDILTVLVERQGTVVEKQELLALVWPGAFVEEGNLAYNVSLLRKALGDSAATIVETVPKRGYRFAAAIEPPVPPATLAVEPTPVPPRRRRRWAAIIVAAAALAIIAGWIIGPRARRIELKPTDLVLIAAFENLTGDPGLDGVAESALEAELTRVPHLGIAPPQRVDDVLRLMRREPGSRVPRSLARDACLRDPALRAAVTGSIRKIGTGYLIDAQLIDASDGRTISSSAVRAANADEILPVLERIGAEIRDSLTSQRPAGRADRPLEKATTDSLPALKVYGDAQRLGVNGRWAEAEILLRRAVQLDPRFASANILLAWSLFDQGRPDDQVAEFADRALALADETSERESLFIRASYHHFRTENLQAIPYYEVLAQRYPDHLWSLNNLVILYSRTGQYQRAFASARQLARLRPPGASPTTLDRTIDFVCFCDRAEPPAYSGSADDQPVSAGVEAYYRAVAAWRAGDLDRSKVELDKISDAHLTDAVVNTFAALGYETLGQFAAAERMFDRVDRPTLKLRWRMWNALVHGKPELVRKDATSLLNIKHFNPTSAIAMIRAGDMSDAVPYIAQEPDFGKVEDVARAELMFAQNRLAEPDIARLQDRVDRIAEIPWFSEGLLGAQLLAKVYLAKGRPQDAIGTLERVTSQPRACGGFPRAMLWMQARYDLLQLYRHENRTHDAEKVRDELAQLLRLADPTYLARRGL